MVRASAHALQMASARDALAEHALGFVEPGPTKIVSGFFPVGTEIDTTRLLETLAKEGYFTCLPIVIGEAQPLLFRQWQSGDKTQIGAWNIPIPLSSAKTVVPDILLVPLLAYDRAGFRLGYGGGFYDRTIDRLRQSKDVVTIGVAYSAQEVTNVPRDEHDQQLDWILTEKGPMKCG